MNGTMGNVVYLGRQLANGVARLTWVTSGYGWLGLVVPVLVALPAYIFGDLTLGGLMMAVGAFNQVQTALRWFVDNVHNIADWRATLLRVMRFREGLLSLSTPADEAEQIAVEPHPYGKLAFENCAILLPPAEAVMFMPPRPYLPITTLRAAVAYPGRADGFDDDAVRSALKRVGLERLISKLADTERWDKVLSADEQQRLSLARLVLQAPSWVFFEDTTPCTNEEHCRLVRSIFANELSGATVIAIGSSPALKGFYTRTLRLRRFQPDPQAWLSPYHRPRYSVVEAELQAAV
jgi:putative ATP-binding cassette transporter